MRLDDTMETIEAITKRRSVRGFTDENVGDEAITSILEAGRWAPSGLNNQPWRFIVVRNPEKKVELSKLTVYGPTIKNAPVLVVVFLDMDHMYNYVKDVQSIGACIQNMLLCIHSLGLGGVWLGEILKSSEMVNKILDAPDTYELMAVIALGHPASKLRISERKELDQLVFHEKFGKSW
jgi:nitroreductase